VTWTELAAWLKPYQELAYPVLATLSDGEDTIAAAFKSCCRKRRTSVARCIF